MIVWELVCATYQATLVVWLVALSVTAIRKARR